MGGRKRRKKGCVVGVWGSGNLGFTASNGCSETAAARHDSGRHKLLTLKANRNYELLKGITKTFGSVLLAGPSWGVMAAIIPRDRNSAPHTRRGFITAAQAVPLTGKNSLFHLSSEQKQSCGHKFDGG